MIFHKQEHVSKGKFRGSSYPTVIACLLEIELHEVPYFHLLYWDHQPESMNLIKHFQNRYLDGKTIVNFKGTKKRLKEFTESLAKSYTLWKSVKDCWLASLGYEEVHITDIDRWLIEHRDTPYMASGKRKNGVDHVVIYMNGNLYHDPHPDNEGLSSVYSKAVAFKYLKRTSCLQSNRKFS